MEWRLQVQLAFSTEVNLAPSRPEYPCKEYGLPGRLPVGQNFGCFLMKEKHKNHMQHCIYFYTYKIFLKTYYQEKTIFENSH
jgi:hypothetical protein